MKRLIRYKQIEAMSIVNPTLCDQLSVQVEVEQRNEGPIPHVHVYLDKSRNPKNCAYIRLDRAEFAPHHESTSMKKKHKRDFLKIMSEICPLSYFESITNPSDVRKATGYQDAVETWLRTYPNSQKMFTFDQDGFPVMPDYLSML